MPATVSPHREKMESPKSQAEGTQTASGTQEPASGSQWWHGGQSGQAVPNR